MTVAKKKAVHSKRKTTTSKVKKVVHAKAKTHAAAHPVSAHGLKTHKKVAAKKAAPKRAAAKRKPAIKAQAKPHQALTRTLTNRLNAMKRKKLRTMMDYSNALEMLKSPVQVGKMKVASTSYLTSKTYKPALPAGYLALVTKLEREHSRLSKGIVSKLHKDLIASYQNIQKEAQVLKKAMTGCHTKIAKGKNHKDRHAMVIQAVTTVNKTVNGNGHFKPGFMKELKTLSRELRI